MKIAVMTAREPLYLPAFFDKFLKRRARDIAGVFVCSPVYKKHTIYSMLGRYVRSFGVWNTFILAFRVANAGMRDVLRIGSEQGRFYSIRSVAEAHGVDLLDCKDVNSPELLRHLRGLGVDLVLSVSCPQIFKKDLIDLPALGCLNIHGSNLPDYRGLMPSFWMMADGKDEAAVTVFFIDAGIDTGDVAGKRTIPIYDDDTLHSFIVRSKSEGCDLVLDVLDWIESGTLSREPLKGKGNYCGWPTRQAYDRFRKRGRKLW